MSAAEDRPEDNQPETEESAENFAPEDMIRDDEQNSRIAELEAELAKAREQTLRALAEAENTRNRARRDREEAGKYAAASFARDLLAVADNFRRAIDSVPAELKESDPRILNVITGIEAVEKEFLRVFERHGVRRIEPKGEKFDPHFHEVMFEAPVPGQESGTIIELIEPGYVIHDRLLRPARVGVAKAAEASETGNGGQVDQEV